MTHTQNLVKPLRPLRSLSSFQSAHTHFIQLISYRTVPHTHQITIQNLTRNKHLETNVWTVLLTAIFVRKYRPASATVTGWRKLRDKTASYFIFEQIGFILQSHCKICIRSLFSPLPLKLSFFNLTCPTPRPTFARLIGYTEFRTGIDSFSINLASCDSSAGLNLYVCSKVSVYIVTVPHKQIKQQKGCNLCCEKLFWKMSRSPTSAAQRNGFLVT